jgi:hypothetical protein
MKADELVDGPIYPRAVFGRSVRSEENAASDRDRCPSSAKKVL